MRAWKIFLAIVLYMGALHYGISTQKGLQYTHILLDSPATGTDVQRIQEQEWESETPVGFCFWGQSQNQLVTCLETGGKATVTPVFLAGNPGLMSAQQLAWQDGCLVDRETARDLFGTASVGSQVLWYQGKPYPVLGITEAVRPTVILMAEAETELDRVLLSIPPQQGSAVGNQYLLRWGIQGKVLDTTLIMSLLQNTLLIFPFLMITLICTCLRKGWNDMTWDGVMNGEQLPLLGKLTFCAVIFLGGICFLGSLVMIPGSMIPTKWSDFSFWNRWWRSEKENITAILFAPVENSQLQMMVNMIKSVISNLFACLVLLWPRRR